MAELKNDVSTGEQQAIAAGITASGYRALNPILRECCTVYDRSNSDLYGNLVWNDVAPTGVLDLSTINEATDSSGDETDIPEEDDCQPAQSKWVERITDEEESQATPEDKFQPAFKCSTKGCDHRVVTKGTRCSYCCITRCAKCGEISNNQRTICAHCCWYLSPYEYLWIYRDLEGVRFTSRRNMFKFIMQLQ